MPTVNRYSFKNQAGTTAGNTISASAAVVRALIVNTGAASTVITLYDGTSTGGRLIGTFSGVNPITFMLDIDCKTGIFLVVAAGAADVTVTFQ